MSRTLTLAAVAAALAGMVAVEVALFSTAVPELMPGRPAPADPGARPNTTPPSAAAWVATALERPLFRQDRRPATTASLAVQPDGAMRLAGVITGPFGSRVIFMSSSGSKPIVVGEGARVSTFVVRSISQGQAVVETEGGTHTLQPSFASAGLTVLH